MLENKKVRQLVSSLSKNTATSMTTQELLRQLQIEENEFEQLIELLIENCVITRNSNEFHLNREGYQVVIQQELPVVWEVLQQLSMIRDRISSVSVNTDPASTDLSSSTITIITDTDSKKLIHRTLQSINLENYTVAVFTKSQLLQQFEINKEGINNDSQLEIVL